MLKYVTTDISDVKLGTTDIQKIMFGAYTIWERVSNPIAISGTTNGIVNFNLSTEAGGATVYVDNGEFKIYAADLTTSLEKAFDTTEGHKITSVTKFSPNTNITTYRDMFSKCKQLGYVNFTGLDSSNVTAFRSTFYQCSGLTTVAGLEQLNTSSLDSIRYMFYQCSGLTAPINLSGWDTSRVTDMYQAFNSTRNLTSLNLSGWTTTSVTNMNGIFASNNSLTYLNLSGWDLTGLGTTTSNRNNMFRYCQVLSTLVLDGWSMKSLHKLDSYTYAKDLPLTTLSLNGVTLSSPINLSTYFTVSSITALYVTASFFPITNSFTYDMSSLTSWNDSDSLAQLVSELPTVTGCTLKLSETTLSVLSSAQISAIMAKGWTILPLPYDSQYLTFKAQESGTFTLTIHANVTTSNVTSVSYSVDNGTTWVTTQNSSSQVVITTPTIASGGTVLWKGIANNYGISNSYRSVFSSTCNFEAYGNTMSLLYGDNFSEQTTLTASRTFNCLFQSCATITSATNLILPATTLTSNCYDHMFSYCTSLTASPELPATTMQSDCYSCMFEHCTSLTTAPELPATTLVSACYYAMFLDCSSLNYIKCLATTNIGASYSTYVWVQNVASSGTFAKASSASWSTGNNGIPRNWTVENAT